MNNINPAVDKAVLLLLALAEKEATQAELCTALGIAPSTAFRILTTLLSHRWIRKKAGGVFELGDGLLPLKRDGKFHICGPAPVPPVISPVTEYA